MVKGSRTGEGTGYLQHGERLEKLSCALNQKSCSCLRRNQPCAALFECGYTVWNTHQQKTEFIPSFNDRETQNRQRDLVSASNSISRGCACSAASSHCYTDESSHRSRILFVLNALAKSSDKKSLRAWIQEVNHIQTLHLIPITLMHFRPRLGRAHQDAGTEWMTVQKGKHHWTAHALHWKRLSVPHTWDLRG